MFFEMDCACKGKNLDKMIQPAILMLLYRQDMHGFAIVQELSRTVMFGGAEPDKAGVYRYLKKMEEADLLTSEWKMDEDGDKPKRVFSITDHGKTCLVNWRYALSDYAENLKKLSDEIGNVIREKR